MPKPELKLMAENLLSEKSRLLLFIISQKGAKNSKLPP
jgi:hypothetical protein